MNDPHVASLQYRAIVEPPYEFQDPPDLGIASPDFEGTLSNGLLTLKHKSHFSTEAEVKPIADNFVLAWQIDAGLCRNQPWLNFSFVRSDIVDGQPTPGAIHASIVENTAIVTSVAMTVGMR